MRREGEDVAIFAKGRGVLLGRFPNAIGGKDGTDLRGSEARERKPSVTRGEGEKRGSR